MIMTFNITDKASRKRICVFPGFLAQGSQLFGLVAAPPCLDGLFARVLRAE